MKKYYDYEKANRDYEMRNPEYAERKRTIENNWKSKGYAGKPSFEFVTGQKTKKRNWF